MLFDTWQVKVPAKFEMTAAWKIDFNFSEQRAMLRDPEKLSDKHLYNLLRKLGMQRPDNFPKEMREDIIHSHGGR